MQDIGLLSKTLFNPENNVHNAVFFQILSVLDPMKILNILYKIWLWRSGCTHRRNLEIIYVLSHSVHTEDIYRQGDECLILSRKIKQDSFQKVSNYEHVIASRVLGVCHVHTQVLVCKQLILGTKNLFTNEC